MRKLIFAFCTASFLSGCTTFHGGMPNLPFDPDADLGIVKDNLQQSISVNTYYSNPSTESRNKFISTRLVITNIEYLRFIKELSAEEAQIHSASDILVLSLDIASAAFTPVNTKTILSSLSSVVGGARLSIDKNIFAEKTMSILISAMNAQRKEVLKRIIEGISRDLNGYTFEQAITDLNDYYIAGSINGALSSIQKDAATKEAAADKAISIMMTARSAGFVDANLQAKVDKLLDNIDQLSDAQARSLAKNPPVRDSSADAVSTARDPNGLRFKSRNAAIADLKMRAVLSRRDETSLAAWEAAVIASNH